MTKVDRLIRGMDKATFDQFKLVVIAKHGKSRGKHSLVAQELNILIGMYCRTAGAITSRDGYGARKHKDTILDEIDGNLEDLPVDDGPLLIRKELQMQLDNYGIIDPRTRKTYENYAERRALRRIDKKYNNAGIEVA